MRIILFYTVLVLAVMLPLLVPGFILTLDMVFVPHPPLPDDITSSYLFHAALHFLSYIVPGDVLQKALLFGILLLAGIGTHKLVKNLQAQTVPPVVGWGAYFAGVFYMVNPFVYGRFMAGQYAVLLGYALLPFFFLALLKFLAQPTRAGITILTGCALAISIVSIHTLGLLAIVVLVASSAALWRRRQEKRYILDVIKLGVSGCIGLILLSGYWLVPTLLGTNSIAESVDSFSVIDRQAFATDGGLLNVLALQGFWVEAQGLFTLPGEPLPLSGVWQLLLFAIIATGVVSLWRQQRALAVTLGVVGGVAVVLAVGGPLNQLLTTFVPLFAGYREPHKFIALLALAYAVFAAFGVTAIISKIRPRSWGRYCGAILPTLPILVTPTMLWGFNGQLKSVQYPADWYVINARLSHVQKKEKVLFLPWHLYMKFDFNGRIVANPASKFFDATIVGSNDPEFAGLVPRSDPTQTGLSDEILPRAKAGTHMGATLERLGIHYVLLAKEVDYEDYVYLDRQTDLRLVTETPNLKLYRVAAANRRGEHADY